MANVKEELPAEDRGDAAAMRPPDGGTEDSPLAPANSNRWIQRELLCPALQRKILSLTTAPPGAC